MKAYCKQCGVDEPDHQETCPTQARALLADRDQWRAEARRWATRVKELEARAERARNALEGKT